MFPDESQNKTGTPGQGVDKKPVIVNAVKLDPDNPIPLNYGGNSFTTITGQRYIPFLDLKDNLPNILWEARLNSCTKNACVTSLAQTCVGNGLFVPNTEDGKLDKDFLAFIANINPDGESLNDLTRLGIEAMETDGNAWIEIVRGTLGTTKYIRAYLHTTLVCRLIADSLDETEKPKTVLRSHKFAERRSNMIRRGNLKAVELPLYSPLEIDQTTAWRNIKGDDHTCIHLKNRVSAVLHYGLPRSVAGLRFEVLEGGLAQYNIDQIDNNMVLSALIVFKSPMSTKEANAAAREILYTHTGNGKRGRVGVISSENGIEDFEYKPMDTKKEGSYIEMDKRIVEKIITASNWDAIFFGMGSEGTLGKGSQYIRAVYDVKKATVIDPITNYWIGQFINPLIKIASEHLGKPEWLKYKIAFRTAMPFSYSSDINVNKVLTKNEGREMIGREKKAGDDWEQPIDGRLKPEPKQEEKENVPPEPVA